MLPKEDRIFNTLTPKIKLAYADTKLVSETEYCQTFDAISRTDNQKHTIRALNVTSEFYKENPNLAVTLFLQELLYLCTKFPDAVMIESLESTERGQFACAIKHCQSLKQLMEKDKFDVTKEVDCDQLLKNVLSDVKFLLTKLKISYTLSIELQSIYQISETRCYFLSDWIKGLEKPSKSEITTAWNNPNGAGEVYN